MSGKHQTDLILKFVALFVGGLNVAYSAQNETFFEKET
jgi:hypothetical protein